MTLYLGIYLGTKDSGCVTGSIIGANSGVFVGGHVNISDLSHHDSNYKNTVNYLTIWLGSIWLLCIVTNIMSMQIVNQSFQGCLHSLRIMGQRLPEESWNLVEWTEAVEMVSTYPSWYGCPISLEPSSTHFLGQGERTTMSHVREVQISNRITQGTKFLV